MAFLAFCVFGLIWFGGFWSILVGGMVGGWLDLVFPGRKHHKTKKTLIFG